MYLSTTDYIQHKHAPGDPVANDFYRMMDSYWAELDALGATIVLTADHGMTPMHKDDGRPAVVYLQSLLDEMLGKDQARVILPITDPYVVPPWRPRRLRDGLPAGGGRPCGPLREAARGRGDRVGRDRRGRLCPLRAA